MLRTHSFLLLVSLAFLLAACSGGSSVTEVDTGSSGTPDVINADSGEPVLPGQDVVGVDGASMKDSDETDLVVPVDVPEPQDLVDPIDSVDVFLDCCGVDAQPTSPGTAPSTKTATGASAATKRPKRPAASRRASARRTPTATSTSSA